MFADFVCNQMETPTSWIQVKFSLFNHILVLIFEYLNFWRANIVNSFRMKTAIETDKITGSRFLYNFIGLSGGA